MRNGRSSRCGSFWPAPPVGLFSGGDSCREASRRTSSAGGHRGSVIGRPRPDRVVGGAADESIQGTVLMRLELGFAHEPICSHRNWPTASTGSFGCGRRGAGVIARSGCVDHLAPPSHSNPYRLSCTIGSSKHEQPS